MRRVKNKLHISPFVSSTRQNTAGKFAGLIVTQQGISPLQKMTPNAVTGVHLASIEPPNTHLNDRATTLQLDPAVIAGVYSPYPHS